ncbi:MAG: SRPBCC family protein [Chloroflexi bacterium]|nr:SRPBCC family protein [Chloroflexota bacterium]MCI0575193.1 SRPBCC family protein [Chloroflexota bacterium]MCI0647125.1 SRPBCC family protein [Chloroflexota bacterium]MCI0729999.1 SRPBCC family protein [Chloroflexota bacterium]
MTTIVERSIIINAMPDKIDAITLDGSRLPEWYTGIEAATVDNLYPEPGGAVDIIYKAAGVTFKMTMTSLRLARRQSLLLRLEGMIVGKSRWIYTPEGDATRVTSRFEYEMPGGDVGKALNKLVLERVNAENLEKSLNSLKALVEGDNG